MNMMINQPMAPTMQTVNPMFTSYANFNMMMNPSLPYIIPNFHPIIIPNSTMMINQPMTNIMPTRDIMKSTRRLL